MFALSTAAPQYRRKIPMSWTIERRHDHVAVVTMNTNKVNAQNPAFFADLHAAFDRLETEFNDCAVVLTGTGAAFSAGLDFDHHFPLYARRSLKEIDGWFDASARRTCVCSRIQGRPWRRSTATHMPAA
jgi:enoyl-CoA hydratase/carnithine racemase